MVNLKVAQILGNDAMVAAFNKLQQAPVPMATGKLILTWAQSLEAEMRKAAQTRMEIVQKYAKKDEAGQPILVDGNFDVKDSIEEINKEMEVLFTSDIEISLPKINSKELQHARLSSVEWATIDFLISEKQELKLV